MIGSLAALLVSAVAANAGKASSAIAACPPPPVESPVSSPPAPPRPRAFEVVGPYSDHESYAPFEVDWRKLAGRHLPGFSPGKPLPPALLARVREQMKLPVDEGWHPPTLEFTAPASEAPAGSLYLLGVQGVVPIRARHLLGRVLLGVREDGCDAGPRGYSGGYVLAFPPGKPLSATDGRTRRGGLLLRARAPLRASVERLEARVAMVGREETVVLTRRAGAGPREEWQVPSPGSGRIVGALLVTARGTSERLLYVHVEEESNCSTQVGLFLLTPAPVRVGSGSADCDV